MKPLSTRAHGVVDYTFAALVYVLPRAAGWSAKVTALMTGSTVGTLAYSALTRYELGAVKLLPMRAHFALDVANCACFLAAPFVFPDENRTVKSLLVGLGLFGLSVVALTEASKR